jgi:2-oxoglutarate ferredoxin oxidoreductase subunit delta
MTTYFGNLKPKKGDIHINRERCKGCGFCVEYCPRHVLVLDDMFNRKGYHPPRVTRPRECINCNLCEMLCPEFAIFSHASPLPEVRV